MSERDQELDELERDLVAEPFIHRADEIEEGKGQTCFINQDRECQPDCTAFNIYADPQQGPERCILLVYMGNSAVNTQELVGASRLLIKQSKTQGADAARAALASAPVPDPFGGKAP
jgi:hypothetical protein